MIVLAYERLIAAVRAEFAEYQVDCDNLFGWRVPSQHTVKDRIVWVPGNAQSGDLGQANAPKWPGRNPRPLASMDELFTVFITGKTTPEKMDDEEAQYRATRLLFDAWFRAVYRSAHGTFELKNASWVINRKERRNGAVIRVLLSLEAKVSDHAHDEAAPNTVGGEFTMKIKETNDSPVVIPVP
jgi:hypothetical protein